MEKIYLNDDDDVKREKPRIDRGEVEAWCGVCQAPAEVFRLRGEADAPIYRISCPLDDYRAKHFMFTYTVDDPEKDRVLGISRDD